MGEKWHGVVCVQHNMAVIGWSKWRYVIVATERVSVPAKSNFNDINGCDGFRPSGGHNIGCEVAGELCQAKQAIQVPMMAKIPPCRSQAAVSGAPRRN